MAILFNKKIYGKTIFCNNLLTIEQINNIRMPVSREVDG